MIVLAVAAMLLLAKTPFGRWLYATGGNERAAELSGVPIRRVKTAVYVISGPAPRSPASSSPPS